MFVHRMCIPTDCFQQYVVKNNRISNIVIHVSIWFSVNYTGCQGSTRIGLGVRELTQFVYNVCTVLSVSFGGPHFLRILYNLLNVPLNMYTHIYHDENPISYYWKCLVLTGQ